MRYRTGDRGRFLPEPCPCGSPLRRLERVRARYCGRARLQAEARRPGDVGRGPVRAAAGAGRARRSEARGEPRRPGRRGPRPGAGAALLEGAPATAPGGLTALVGAVASGRLRVEVALHRAVAAGRRYRQAHACTIEAHRPVEHVKEILDEVLALLDGGEDFALVKLIGDRGSTPRAAGAEMLVRRDGAIAGTIGGGLLELTMMRRPPTSSRPGASRVVDLRLAGKDLASDEEMVCGGTAEVLITFVPAGDAQLPRGARGGQGGKGRTPPRLALHAAADRRRWGRRSSCLLER